MLFLDESFEFFSAYEKHTTYSKYHLAVAIKLTIALFLNTGVIPILTNPEPKEWFTSSGLVTDVFYKILSVGFISPIFYVFSIPCCLKSCRLSFNKN
jgi:hypothetical protein